MANNHRRTRREPIPRPELRCECGAELRRYWPFCSNCGRRQVWRDQPQLTGAECYNCGWVVSDKFSHCPWCGVNIYEEGFSSEEPLKSTRGFRYDARCDWGCGGGLEYPMPYCSWCGKEQSWRDDEFEGTCPHCERGVNDWWNVCPWCGRNSSGQDLIPEALTRVRRLLVVSRIKPWGYRVLLRPGVSGVDPRWPKVVEIEQRYVVGKRKKDEIPWSTLVGLITHELGHSFLYHNWRWTRTERFRRVFGKVDQAYRGVDDTWVDFQRRRVATTPTDFVTAYAATHPQEDFAETFRFYVTRRGRMRELLAELGQKRKGLVVYEKFLTLHDYLRGRR